MAEPSEKSREIEQLLNDMLGVSRRQGIRSNVCVWCGGPADKFRDALSRKEYTISGFCQICQDKTFGVDNEE